MDSEETIKIRICDGKLKIFPMLIVVFSIAHFLSHRRRTYIDYKYMRLVIIRV